MQLLPIGRLSFFTNVPAGHRPTDEECVAVANDIRRRFEAGLQAAGLADQVRVAGVDYRRGCIVTGLTLVVVVGGAYKVVADYRDKLRPSLMQIWSDLKALKVVVGQALPPQTTWPYDPALSTARQMAEDHDKLQRGELPPLELTLEVREIAERPSR